MANVARDKGAQAEPSVQPNRAGVRADRVTETSRNERRIRAAYSEESRKSVALHKAGKTGEAGVLVPLVLTKGESGSRFVKLKAVEMRFLKYLEETGDPVEAVRKSEITMRQYRKLLRKKDFKELVQDRAEELAIRKGITGDWWMKKGLEMFEGKMVPTFAQMTVWKELGSRVKPKPKEEGGDKARPVININLGNMEKAKARIIDAKNAEIG